VLGVSVSVERIKLLGRPIESLKSEILFGNVKVDLVVEFPLEEKSLQPFLLFLLQEPPYDFS